MPNHSVKIVSKGLSCPFTALPSLRVNFTGVAPGLDLSLLDSRLAGLAIFRRRLFPDFLAVIPTTASSFKEPIREHRRFDNIGFP